jgi:hypothetical protein
MNKTLFSLASAALLLAGGCGNLQEGFVRDKAAWKQIEEDFELKRSALPDGDLFDVFCRAMEPSEREALMFLYAYMPLGDVTDYPGEFYLRNIRASFRAREEMPWGASVPEALFRHFVLPVRVNNENLDESRPLFYEELKERVENLSLRQAILEVNHWCHEKVIYAPSDARTSSPLASVKTAGGRCGEESVFTVAALRAVGIPARQVYTPRWAHTDDNHAWVEAWADGRWYFMGACEPEPELNMAWFNAPAGRGMLMHAKVFGRYRGPEEIIEQTACYTEINVIENYAPAARATVRVTDTAGRPVAGALVEFKLYNYAEFYTVSRKTTGRGGEASLLAGKGDMLVWATGEGGRFGFGKLSFGKDDTLALALDKRPGEAIDLSIDIVPPAEGSIPAEATEAQRRENARRLAVEDSLRNRYAATFYTAEKARRLARELGIDEAKTVGALVNSRGNGGEIERFLREAPDGSRALALALLGSISDKDLRDTPAPTLSDHLRHSAGDSSPASFVPWVLNPRISDELLSPYKSFFRRTVTQDIKEMAQKDPQALAGWVGRRIRVVDSLNPQRIPVMPSGVWKSCAADSHSRDIFFVALARSLGIPARIEPVGGKVQYLSEGKWLDAHFGASPASASGQGSLRASYAGGRSPGDPKYYSHFTIARIREDGTLRTLNFEPESEADMGAGDTWSRLLKNPLPMDAGHYLLTTGARMAKGNVLVRLLSFSLTAGQTTEIEMQLRENAEDVRVIGSIDAEAVFRLAGSGAESSILSTTGRGYFVLALLGARQEPTNHALRDIAALRESFESWNRSMLFLFPGAEDWEKFDAGEFASLPGTITYGLDPERRIADMLVAALRLPSLGLPVFVIADTFGRVVFVSQGYTIGLGEQMLQVIHKL